MNADMEQFLKVFIEECAENLDIMEQELLSFELETTSNETINTIFRAAHSIKGGAATFELIDIANFTHLMETLLDEIRNKERDMSKGIIELLLQSVDLLRSMLAQSQGESPESDINQAELEKQFNELLGSESKSSAEETSNDANDGSGWRIIFTPKITMLFSGNEPLRLLRGLSELGEFSCKVLLDRLPDWQDLEAENCYLAWECTLLGQISKADICEVFEWVEDECELEVIPLSEAPCQQTAAPTPQESAPANTEASSASALSSKIVAPETSANDSNGANGDANRKAPLTGASIRVDISKVDSLINLVGELVITQAMLTELGNNFQMDKLEDLNRGLEQLLGNTKELQESVLSIRMLPISFAFNRFPRLVRDAAIKLNKEVNLTISGETTELDKTVMEQIIDPLVHLVRNAVDHGIESPQVRKQNGKPEQGTIELKAFHQGGNIVVEIKDDGAGLNKTRIWEKATEKGLTANIAPTMEQASDEQIFELIFAAGFSTNDEVNDLSGRGVGMDVVRSNINKLGGQIEIESQPDQGSTFRISLPLTLAIVDGQLVTVGNETFVIPLISIVESIQVEDDNLNLVSGGVELYRLREENIPVVRLDSEFGIDTTEESEQRLLCVVEAGGQKIGLVVDELLGQQQVVIKSLDTHYRKISGISGATILGNGMVSLILDIPGMVNGMLKRRNHRTTKAA